LDLATALTLVVTGMIIGIAIGSTGIGGVLLVPFLIYALGMSAPLAVALALWSFLWSGLVAAGLYARHGSIAWREAVWLSLAALPGAYLGAHALGLIPPMVLEFLIAALIIAGAVNSLRAPPSDAAIARPPGPLILLLLGAITGLGSALLGASGALILVPILVALRQPVLPSIGLGQAIQVPIAAVASLANWLAGRIDVGEGLILAVALSLGIAIGTPLAHALPQRALGRLLAITMLGAAAAMVLHRVLPLTS
jgi:uncharacterized membrane protein YfcA